MKANIILCSFDGKKYLHEQIKSIQEQSYQHWDLLIRDDGSQDGSLEIVQVLNKHNSQIKLIEDEKGNLGASGNFASLLETTYKKGLQYIAFSDQDDVWEEDKLSSQISGIQQLECCYPDAPLLVHSDMEVVDASLSQISPSFMFYQGIRHEACQPLQVLLAQNFITGCTIIVNSKLLDIALPIPEDALMHDWWLALCAAVFGHIGYIDKPLLKYRQHGGNAVGAKHFNDLLNPISGEWKKGWLAGRDNLFKSMKQAEALAERIRKHEPNNENLSIVEAYASLQYDKPMQRIRKIKKLKVHAQSNMRQALLLSRLLFTSRVDKHD